MLRVEPGSPHGSIDRERLRDVRRGRLARLFLPGFARCAWFLGFGDDDIRQAGKRIGHGSSPIRAITVSPCWATLACSALRPSPHRSAILYTIDLRESSVIDPGIEKLSLFNDERGGVNRWWRQSLKPKLVFHCRPSPASVGRDIMVSAPAPVDPCCLIARINRFRFRCGAISFDNLWRTDSGTTSRENTGRRLGDQGRRKRGEDL